MTIAQTNEPTPRMPLRLWPGVVAVVLQWLLWYVVPIVVTESGLFGMIGGAVCALVLVVWWLFFSRALWSERVGAIILMIVAVFATKRIVHPSMAGAGMGMLLYISTIPGLSLALVAWAMATRRFPNGARRASLVAAILLACAPWTLLRTAGIIGGAGSEFHWRWTPTPEERLLAQGSDEPLDPSTRSGSSRAPSRDDSAVGGVALPSAPAAAVRRAHRSSCRSCRCRSDRDRPTRYVEASSLVWPQAWACLSASAFVPALRAR
jgi:hypothetical protein